jgi:soluble lytic murein transglycosylase
LEDARLLVAERDYAAAKAAVAQIPQRRGGAVDPTDVLRVLADALYGLGETDRALAVLRELVEGYPTSAAAPPALFRRASILWNRDRDAEALRGFEEFGRRYPHQPRAAEVFYAIGRIHQQAGRTAAATATYRELSRRYPRSKLAREAQWRIGWIQYQARNWTAAAGTFAQLASRTRSRPRDEAAYWQGRALERTGQAAAARQLYRDIVQRNPISYYAMWARHRLDRSLGGFTMHHGTPPMPPAPPALASPPATDTFHLPRAEELRAAGLNGLARTELAAIERAYDYDSATLRYLLHMYQTVDGHAAALRLARRLGRRADLSPEERERLRYPLAFWETVRREADAQAIDPLLVVALMRQESLFDPAARSPANAVGLMQLLPATAERVAGASEPPIDHGDLTDPEVNVQLGTRYLRSLLARFGGDPLKALAAYNGGEHAVEKWQRHHADLDADEFVENITYRETRDYVKRVVANYQAYQQLYNAAEH